MQPKTTFKFLSATFMSLMLVACGGGSGSALDNTINNGNSSSSSSSSSSSAISSSSSSVAIQDTLQSLEFTDALPGVIYLKGTGGAESALVRFRTMGKTGKPIQNIKVNFALTSTIGGLALTQNSAVSDADGYISTNINSGSVSTSIRVTATINDNIAITTQSSELVIATGLPDQKSMSIALEKFNPASWNYNGVTADVSMLLADAYNNPAPDGTAVYLTTEGGSIQPSCTTVGGACKVVWKSQSPRPPRNSNDNSIERILCLGVAPSELAACESERAGRSTILATTIGNESFKDINGNGIFDLGIDTFRASPASDKCKLNVPTSSFEASTEAEACDDLAEAYLDSNENGSREPSEHFVNFITTTKDDIGTDSYSSGNGIYNGSFCREKDELDGKCSRTPITIRKEHMVVMSCDQPLLENGSLPVIGSGQYAVADCNGNSLPAGTTITIGTNQPTTIGNQYDWTSISAPGGTVVKIKVPSGSEISITTPLPNDTRRLGSGFGADFINGGLEVGIGVSTLSPGGNTSITAYIVNTNGELITDSMNVTFSSPCLSSGNAIITGGNLVASVNGKATANYVSTGCRGVGGADEVKATATYKNALITGSNYVFVKADSAQTISFVDATPSLISLKGTGGAETSTLRFRVLGQTGTPLKGECVNFALSTTVGELALVPSNCNPAGPETFGASTDANGYVTTIIQAGTVPTVVRVTATTANGISTQSSALAVTTGIPDQNSASLSLTELNPVGWLHDGVTSTAVIRLADAFNNPVPNGTAVTFTTSGGAIDGSCTTTAGTCSVQWRSQNPRPTPAATVSFSGITANGGYTMSCSDGSAECRKGRVSILATAIGNESFIDGNGNGLYDDISTDIFTNSNGVLKASTRGLPITNTPLCSLNAPNSSAAYGVNNSCDDLREAYVDKNFNGDRDIVEEFADFNKNGAFDLLPNGKYDGALCAGAAKTNGDCTTNKVTVRSDATFVMSCELPYGNLPGFNSFSIAGGAAQVQFPILLADCNGNGMPVGTTVKVNSANLDNATATLSLSGGLAMSIEPTTFLLFVKPDKDPLKVPSGTITLDVTAAGVTSSYTVNVN